MVKLKDTPALGSTVRAVVENLEAAPKPTGIVGVRQRSQRHLLWLFSLLQNLSMSKARVRSHDRCSTASYDMAFTAASCPRVTYHRKFQRTSLATNISTVRQYGISCMLGAVRIVTATRSRAN